MKKPLAAVAAVILIAVAAIFIASLPAANINITQTDMDQAVTASGGVITREVTISEGDTFAVSLYAHWSSGMRWSASSGDFHIVKQDNGRDFTNSFPLPIGVGGPGREKWTFKALEKGETTITMTYRSVAQLDPRPPVINTLELKVTVK